MGVKLIILLALIVGALYCIHLLAQDFQSIRNPARLLFKRHLNSTNKISATVRWKKILQHDPIACARSLFCQLGSITGRKLTDLESGFIFMIGLEPAEKEERDPYNVFREAYAVGLEGRGSRYAAAGDICRRIYFMCPFRAANLLDLVQYLIHKKLQ